jgi:hypothetical protein
LQGICPQLVPDFNPAPGNALSTVSDCICSQLSFGDLSFHKLRMHRALVIIMQLNPYPRLDDFVTKNMLSAFVLNPQYFFCLVK